ncbi:hypothetical protein D3C72_2167190 [compost metagenome]
MAGRPEAAGAAGASAAEVSVWGMVRYRGLPSVWELPAVSGATCRDRQGRAYRQPLSARDKAGFLRQIN